MLGLIYNPDPTGFDIQGTISSNDAPLNSDQLALNQLPLFTSMQNAIADVGGWTGLTPTGSVNSDTSKVTPISWATMGLVIGGLIIFAEIAGKHGR